VSLIFVPAGLS